MSRIQHEGANKSIRPKIFGKWPGQQNNTRQNRKTFNSNFRSSDTRQSTRAQQVLNKSLMILLNITNFRDQAKKNKERYDKLIRISQDYKNNLEELSRESGRVFDEAAYQLNLKDYYHHIRLERRFYQDTEAFILANLQNYDRRVTAVKLVRNFEQANKQLEDKIKDLKSKRWRLQQSLFLYEQGIQQSQILNTQYNLQTCLQTMYRQISSQKLQQLHYLMLYQLQQSQKQNTQFYINIEKDQQCYSVYEAIHDSMKLMIHQRDEMKSDRLQLENKFSMLTIDNASTIIPSSHQSLPILLKNQRVYDANIELLARYNAETNLEEYSVRRKKYANQLSKYKTKLASWRGQEQICTYLYARHQTLNKYLKKLSLGDQISQIKSQREQVRHAYYDCLSCEVPQQFTSIRKYRVDLIQNLGNSLEQAGIIMPERKQFMLASRSVLRNKQQSRFHKYLNFFIELQKIPNNLKSNYLFQQRDRIKALNYQLNQNNPNDQINNYRNDFDYCLAIAQHQEINKDARYLEKVQKFRKNKWVSLPIGLDSLAFYYTNDVYLKADGQRYIREDFRRKLDIVKQSIEEKMAKNQGVQDPDKSKDNTQYPYQALSTWKPEERRLFFFNYYRRISQYGPFCKKSLFDDYWDAAVDKVFTPYVNAIADSGNLKNKVQISKKYFFTFRILAYLTNQTSKIKLSHYTDLIEYYIGELDKYCMYKWDQAELFMEIIKQRVFVKFLNEKVSKREDLAIEAKVMQKIYQACVLLYESKDQIALWNYNDMETYFEHSIRIHKAWQQLKIEIDPREKLQIQQKCRKFIAGAQKSPLTLGTKVPVEQFQYLMNVKNKIERIKIINKINPNMELLSAMYTRAHYLLVVSDNLGQNYGPSDIVMVTDNNSKALYLADEQNYCKKQLTILRPALLKIIGIYKGKEIEKEVSSKGQTEIESALSEITKKLQAMAV